MARNLHLDDFGLLPAQPVLRPRCRMTERLPSRSTAFLQSSTTAVQGVQEYALFVVGENRKLNCDKSRPA